MDTPTSRPLVSICIPTYNGAKWISQCISSALSQTYQSCEILVMDDASTDETVELARSFGDDRVRVEVSDVNRGLVGNWNECVRRSRGAYIKFLFQDDILYPSCVERMMRAALESAGVGLVFSPRDVIVEDDVGGDAGRLWMETYGELHSGYDVSPGVNDGRALFSQHLQRRFQGCCVGEPTTVLVNKECFRRLGLFNPRLRQACDIEMWLRIMYFYDIGFIDEELSAFRLHAGSTSSLNHRSQKHLFDRFWLLEDLLSYDEIRVEHPEIEQMRDEQRRHHSPFRPSAGWRSLHSAEGRRQALADVALLPRRTRFLTACFARTLRRLWGGPRLREQL